MICTNPRTNQIGSDSKLSHCWLNVRIYGTTKHWWSRATPTGWCKLKVVSFDKYVVVFVESYQFYPMTLCIHLQQEKKTKTLRSNPCQATNHCTEAENLKNTTRMWVNVRMLCVCVCVADFFVEQVGCTVRSRCVHQTDWLSAHDAWNASFTLNHHLQYTAEQPLTHTHAHTRTRTQNV